MDCFQHNPKRALRFDIHIFLSFSEKVKIKKRSNQKGMGYNQLNHVYARMLMRRNAAQDPCMPSV
jgi:hypothetical protein